MYKENGINLSRYTMKQWKYMSQKEEIVIEKEKSGTMKDAKEPGRERQGHGRAGSRGGGQEFVGEVLSTEICCVVMNQIGKIVFHPQKRSLWFIFM